MNSLLRLVNPDGFQFLQYAQRLQSSRGVFLLVASMAIILMECLHYVLPYHTPSRLSTVTGVLAFGKWEMNALQYVNGMWWYNIFGKLYRSRHDLRTVVQLTIISFAGPIISFGLLMSTLPKDPQCLPQQLWLSFFGSSQTCRCTYIFHSMEQTVFSAIAVGIVLMVKSELVRLLHHKISAFKALSLLYLILLIIDVTQTASASELGQSAVRFYHSHQQLFSLSFVVGAAIASRAFIYPLGQQNGSTKLLVNPELTPQGQRSSYLMKNKVIGDSIAIAAVLLKLCVGWFAFTRVSQGGNRFCTVLTDIVTRGLYLALTGFITTIVMYKTPFLPQIFVKAGEMDVWLVLTVSLIAQINRIIFTGIEFGPYSNVILVLVLVGILAEVAVVGKLVEAVLAEPCTRLVRAASPWVMKIANWLREREK